MLKKFLRKITGVENELRGQKLLNSQLLKQNKDLQDRIVSLAQRVKSIEDILGIKI